MTTPTKERRSRVSAPDQRAHPSTLRPDRPRSRASRHLWLPAGQPLAGRAAPFSEVADPIQTPPTPAWKRWTDLACVLAALPLAIPLLVAITVWIRLVSRGPALFHQERVGFGGKKFTLYKFRTMRHGASTKDHEAHVGRLVESDSPMVKLDTLGDSRLIPGGCLLRTAGLDELPQLLNVLRGEMSLVGPRPCLVKEYDFFSASQRERFTVLPGISGLWQVMGKNRATFREMNAMDVHYARHASPLLDLWIMLRTPLALLGQMSDCMAANRRRRQAAAPAYVPAVDETVLG
ncbi:sugar transferase [Luteolibacter sp. Populi]|uniref:sugar transferase n=1 Tax=Luteolibacter sp. Populi TaxID=3230487 RepID=UPI003467CB66